VIGHNGRLKETRMPNRRRFAAAALALLALPTVGSAQDAMPSASQIERKLEAAPRVKIAPNKRVTVREFKQRPELRRMAPSIDIQSINFAFGSAEIPYSQYGKVENIATAVERLLRRRPDTRILIEGHTDAVGSDYSNLVLSERRAASLRQTLVREFGVPRHALETVGYGEDFLLVPTQNENWRNRRVTLRRVDDFLR
jgi:outer membrane protein OmpA-like peptidoglycan-associated protein